MCCVGSDAAKHAEALEGDFPEAGGAGLHFKKVAGRGEYAVALSEVAVLGIEPCVCESVVVGEGGRVESVHLAGVKCAGEGFDVCRACAAVGVVVDEGCAADEGGSVRAGVEAGVGFVVELPGFFLPTG